MSVTEQDPAATPADTARDRLTAAVERDGVDLLRFFQRRSPDAAVAADLYGELLLLALRKEQALPVDPTDCRMFLFGMAKNVIRNQDRGRLRHEAATERLASQLLVDTSAADSTAAAETQADVRAALERLPVRQREVVMLIHWEGFGQAEVGRILGIPAATVRSRYGRARVALARDLGVEA